MNTVQLKTAQVPPYLPVALDQVAFYHPGYDPGESPVFLVLAATDQSQDDPTCWGLYHETALAACRIIAANQPGRLTTDRAGSNPVETPLHGLLTGDAYYYVVNGLPALTKYPIVPSFRDWEFPADGPPAEWKVQRRWGESFDRCQLTKDKFPQQAHLVPRYEGEWLRKSPLHHMAPSAMDAPGNIVRLRSDVHALFDRRMFSFVPKRSGPTQPHVFVAHILEPDESYYATLQNFTLQDVFLRTAPSFLYARFAWSILFRTKPFLTSGHDRVVRVVSKGKASTKTMTAAELQQTYGGGGLHNAIPAKRVDLCDQEADSDDSHCGYEDYMRRYTFGIVPYDDLSQTIEADTGLDEPFSEEMSEG